ncbi:hypothetical protein WN944_023175 [Citrus x changshan-huyou]|uniref:NB-ARC domain-containing protein n=1 Tax=Citrus x changshan-huyou TaxID=2935761 RepID=A0AAP0MZX0_9ROSI
MGGIGKTTLAQLAYNDADVINNFNIRIWVCVSDPFDEFRIAKAIIEDLDGSTPNLVAHQSLVAAAVPLPSTFSKATTSRPFHCQGGETSSFLVKPLCIRRTNGSS